MLLNLFDALATLRLLAKGAEELNPLVSALLVMPLLFVLSKTLLVSGLAVWLSMLRATRALGMAVGVYLAVDAAHVWFLNA